VVCLWLCRHGGWVEGEDGETSGRGGLGGGPEESSCGGLLSD
jgi:hypothetical protein